MPSFTRVLQFLCTHVSTNLGEGHKLMNFPMIPLSAKVREYLQVSSAGRSIEGMLSNFLTNFYCESEVGHLLHAATIFLKASILGGRGGGGASGPPLGAMARGQEKGRCTSGRARGLGRAVIQPKLQFSETQFKPTKKTLETLSIKNLSEHFNNVKIPCCFLVIFLFTLTLFFTLIVISRLDAIRNLVFIFLLLSS